MSSVSVQGRFVVAQMLGAIAEWVTAFAIAKRHQLGKRKNVLWGLLVVLAVGSTVAIGQSAPNPATPQATTSTSGEYTFSQERILSDIAGAVTSKLNALRDNKQLQGFGTTITAFFLAAMLVWTSVKTMATGKGFSELIGEWVPVFVGFGVVNLFLNRGAADQIVATMNNIGAAIGGQDMASLDAAIKAGMEPLFRGIVAVIDQPRATKDAVADTWYGAIVTGWAQGASFIMSVLAKTVTAFFLVLAAVVMAAHIIMGFISVQLVLTLAPVVVPFLMFKPMSWLFDSWLKFLLGACMLKIVVAFMLNVVSGLLTSMSKLASTYHAEAQGASGAETIATDVLMLGLMLVFALLSTLLLTQAPSIATGLLSGSAGSVGFGGLRGVSGGLANRGVGGGQQSAGAAASWGAQKVRNRQSYGAGRDDALSGKPQSQAYRDPQAKAAYKTAYQKFSPPKDEG